jgi:hypothetical protein
MFRDNQQGILIPRVYLSVSAVGRETTRFPRQWCDERRANRAQATHAALPSNSAAMSPPFHYCDHNMTVTPVFPLGLRAAIYPPPPHDVTTLAASAHVNNCNNYCQCACGGYIIAIFSRVHIGTHFAERPSGTGLCLFPSHSKVL